MLSGHLIFVQAIRRKWFYKLLEPLKLINAAPFTDTKKCIEFVNSLDVNRLIRLALNLVTSL